MNPKKTFAVLVILVLIASLTIDVHVAKADNSDDSILFSGGVTVYSPLNQTYNTNFLTLNLTLGLGAGLQYSLNYSIDGKNEEPISLTFNNSVGFQMINTGNGIVKLPELSKGSHRLTIYEEVELNDYHGANPPGAPFKPTTPGSEDYVASWVDTFDFYINSNVLDSWTVKSSMHTARLGVGVAEVNGKVYAIGGFSGAERLNSIEEYDPATDTWTSKASMPTARASPGVAVYQNKIYVIGGGVNGGSTGQNEVYNPATNTWETKAPMPTIREELTTNVVNGKIYCIGGYTTATMDPRSNANEAYDPITDTWTTKAPLPTSAFSCASAVVNDKIYVISGVVSSGNSYGKLNQIYEPVTDTWSTGAEIPTGVQGPGSAAAVDVSGITRIYVIGGNVLSSGITNINQVYDPQTSTWSLGSSMPTPREAFGLALVNNTLYAMGGFSGATIFGNNEQYTPTNDVLSIIQTSSPSPSFSPGPSFSGSPTPTLSPSPSLSPSSTPSPAIPEFPSWIILPLLIAAALFVAAFRRKVKAE